MTDTITRQAPAALPGYTLEPHPNQLARRGCWYVRHDATGVLIGWVGLATGDDGWSALSFAHRDLPDGDGPLWWAGRVAQDRPAQDALEALVAATGDLWLHEQAEQARTRVTAPYRRPTSAQQDAELRKWAARQDYRSGARRRR